MQLFSHVLLLQLKACSASGSNQISRGLFHLDKNTVVVYSRIPFGLKMFLANTLKVWTLTHDLFIKRSWPLSGIVIQLDLQPLLVFHYYSGLHLCTWTETQSRPKRASRSDGVIWRPGVVTPSSTTDCKMYCKDIFEYRVFCEGKCILPIGGLLLSAAIVSLSTKLGI